MIGKEANGQRDRVGNTRCTVQSHRVRVREIGLDPRISIQASGHQRCRRTNRPDRRQHPLLPSPNFPAARETRRPQPGPTTVVPKPISGRRSRSPAGPPAARPAWWWRPVAGQASRIGRRAGVQSQDAVTYSAQSAINPRRFSKRSLRR